MACSGMFRSRLRGFVFGLWSGCRCRSSVAVSCSGCNYLLHYPAFRCLVPVSAVQRFCFISVQENEKLVFLAWSRTSDAGSPEVCEHIQ